MPSPQRGGVFMKLAKKREAKAEERKRQRITAGCSVEGARSARRNELVVSRAEVARIRDLPKAWRLADEQRWLDDYDAEIAAAKTYTSA